MAAILFPQKNAAINPLKSSAPLGAALAYLGLEGAVPLFHGSQGCSSFALTLAVRHFNEDMPLQTTAVNEVAIVLGGADHMEQALVNIQGRMKPKFIGIASTALVETRSEDFVADLAAIRVRRPELADTEIVFASTPDFSGALEDGWSKAVSAILEAIVVPGERTNERLRQVNILPGVHQTSGDIDHLRLMVSAFGLTPVVVPDLSGSLDGHVNEHYSGPTSGGARLADIREMGRALHTIAIGAHMKAPAEALEGLTGVPVTLFPSLTGLKETDALVVLLSHLSGQPVPSMLKRQRSQLVDAMLDCHFHLGGKRIAIAGDPDLLQMQAAFFCGMGAKIVTAVASTANAPLLEGIATEKVIVGDLTDFEAGAQEAGAELLVTHSHGRQAAERLGIPLLRAGFPVFDRLGMQHRSTVGYAGTRDYLYEVTNIFVGRVREAKPDDFAHIAIDTIFVEEAAHGDTPVATC